MIDGTSGKGARISAEGECRDPVPVVMEGLGGLRRLGGVVDRDRGIGGGSGDEVAAVKVPEDRAVGSRAAALVRLPKPHGSSFHGCFGCLPPLISFAYSPLGLGFLLLWSGLGFCRAEAGVHFGGSDVSELALYFSREVQKCVREILCASHTTIIL